MKAPPLDRLVPAHVKNFEPYIPSRPDDELMRHYGCSRLFRLNNNENPLGPPGPALKVIDRFPPPKASVYPSGDAYHLRRKLARHLGLHPDQFLVGNGANEVIGFVIKAFCREGDNIVTADKTFAVYEWVARFSGFDARLAPLVDHAFHEEAIFQLIDDRTNSQLYPPDHFENRSDGSICDLTGNNHQPQALSKMKKDDETEKSTRH